MRISLQRPSSNCQVLFFAPTFCTSCSPGWFCPHDSHQWWQISPCHRKSSWCLEQPTHKWNLHQCYRLYRTTRHFRGSSASPRRCRWWAGCYCWQQHQWEWEQLESLARKRPTTRERAKWPEWSGKGASWATPKFYLGKFFDNSPSLKIQNKHTLRLNELLINTTY